MTRIARQQVRRAWAQSLSEEEWQRQVIQIARAYGWRVAHFRTVRVQRKSGATYYETPVQADGAGFPDLFMVRGSRSVAAELKSEKGSTAGEQEAWLADMKAAGVETHVWKPRDVDRVHEVLGR